MTENQLTRGNQLGHTMNEIECPYCEGENKVDHDGGEGYTEDKAHEMECDHCKKNFVFHTQISLYYSPKKADCLNGSPHKFRQWSKLWFNSKLQEIQGRKCIDCETEERRIHPNH